MSNININDANTPDNLRLLNEWHQINEWCNEGFEADEAEKTDVDRLEDCLNAKMNPETKDGDFDFLFED